ncbi:hypothetical protein P9222_23290 [Paenibacillus amylolyticus]|nr:hypothetical protein [Paenibacillus amylolyticus]WFR61359.1 hypothetical protein P9222_23290 [Paenibacillus amylolyticus]
MKTTERFSYSEDQIIEQNYSWQSLAKLLNYILPYRRKLVGIGSSLFLSVGIKLIIPLLIAYAIDHAMNPYNRQKSLELLYPSA